MSELKIYNSYNRKLEVFKPLVKGHVGLYVCGPTVSGESHLGHARPFITFDIVYRYLLHLGYKVRYVRNITDAGHFEEEGKEAEDKITAKATIEKLEPMELVQKYTNLFHWAMLQFNCLQPSIEPTATGHIVEQIDMIKKIMEKGYAYEVNGSIYFDVKKYAEHYPYGKLSGRILDDLLETTRVLEGQEEKKDRADFALWKKAPAKHLMRWNSPWGPGFPAWHIECSAMSTKYLGGQFDIHGGGMDLQFPHHESEIAQSTIANGEPPVRYWMHNNLITINGRKMGKSYNNVIKLTELFSGDHPLLEKGYSPMTIRFFILQSHYRSTLDFSNEALLAAEKGLNRLWNAYETLQELKHPGKDGSVDQELTDRIRKNCEECTDFMNDDFNTAKVLANMFDLTSLINSFQANKIPVDRIPAAVLIQLKETWKVFLEDIFGLKQEKVAKDDKLGEVMELLLQLRQEARSKKDYALSDQIRDTLSDMGIVVKDEKGGASWSFE